MCTITKKYQTLKKKYNNKGIPNTKKKKRVKATPVTGLGGL
jgi:hypothetical protein